MNYLDDDIYEAVVNFTRIFKESPNATILANLMGRNRSTVRVSVKRLAKRGLLEVSPNRWAAPIVVKR